jgi:ribosomal protein S1
VSEEVISAPESTIAQVDQAEERSIETLRPRQALKGKVARVDLGGAFIDIGIGVVAFIHVSKIPTATPVTRVADLLKLGDEVEVYVAAINAPMKRVDLTMIKPPTYDWADLEIGLRIDNARVVALESFGAFVDIDAPKHGLVPFNLMPKGKRPKVDEMLDTVWVIEASEEKRRIGLTMIEPPAMPWEKIHRGDVLKGTVTRIERKGAFVDVGAEREGLIRSTAFGAGFVNVSDYVTVGEQVSVRVARVDPAKKMLDLSMEGLDPADFELSSGPEEVISPMAAAFQRAQRTRRVSVTQEGKGNRKQDEQDEILSRTLRQLQGQREK